MCRDKRMVDCIKSNLTNAEWMAGPAEAENAGAPGE